MKKKKVIAIFPSILLYGKERSNIEVFRILANEDNVSLTILANNKLTSRLQKEIEIFDVKYCSFPTRERTILRYVKYLYNFVKSNILALYWFCRLKPDIVYINNEMSVYDLFPVLALCKSKIIYRIGDIPAYPSLSGYKVNSFLWRKIVINKVDTIISVSKFIKNEVDMTGRNSKNDIVIYNYPPYRKKNSQRTQRNKSEVLTIGYIGQIRELKGVHILIEALIKAIKQGYKIRLVLAGDTTLFPDYYESLRKVITENETQGDIKFLGEIEDISIFFDQIDILCVPSTWPEALGNVLVEAKQHHKPIIIFPSGGMPELISHKSDGYICKDKTSDSLLGAFSYYINNVNEITLQGHNSYKSLNQLGIVKETFDNKWKKIFELT